MKRRTALCRELARGATAGGSTSTPLSPRHTSISEAFELPEKYLSRIDDCATTIKCKKGQTLLEEGAPVHHLYQVLRGTLQCVSANGTSTLVRTGELSAVSAQAFFEVSLVSHGRLFCADEEGCVVRQIALSDAWRVFGKKQR